MALSNAERQRRYIARLKAAARPQASRKSEPAVAALKARIAELEAERDQLRAELKAERRRRGR